MENRKARFSTSSLQGVSTSICTSFMLSATRGFSIELIPFTFALMSTVRYSSMNACFSPALTIEK
ncbi:unknown [Prevotella sp. CAG:1058]|nr:unknown [Prevotella sp. CAG:1058]